MSGRHVERERRFLVLSDAWRGHGRTIFIQQGYLNTDPARVVRVRTTGERAWLTVKGRSDESGARAEIECEIPIDDARAILGRPQLCVGAIIEKTRTVLEGAGLVWEIDDFAGRNAGLCIAEVEHDDALTVDEWNARIDANRPAWLGDEITGRNEFANSALTERPFDEWPEELRAAVMRGRLKQ